MQTFKFTAINQKGHKISGELDAQNENDLDESLKRLGLELRSFSELTEERRSITGRAKLEDISTFCTEMSIALRANIPLMEAIETVQRGSPSPAIGNALLGIRDLIRQGDSLSDALSFYPRIFSSFFIALVAIGEKTGKLADTFRTLEEYLKWIMALRRRFIKVVRYPLASACFTTGVIWMLLVHIVCFFLYHQYALPDFLIKVLPFSDFVIYYWHILLFGPFILVYSILFFYRHSESFAYQLDKFFLTVPVLSDVITKLDTARFVYFFSSMFNAGFEVEQSLREAEKAVKNRILKQSFAAVSKYVKKGCSLSEAASLSRAFTPMVMQAFRLGEETGDIGGALEKVNYFYRQQADDTIDAFADYLRYALLIMSGIFLAT